jgi:uncharacterized protein (UPF0264 family)
VAFEVMVRETLPEYVEEAEKKGYRKTLAGAIAVAVQVLNTVHTGLLTNLEHMANELGCTLREVDNPTNTTKPNDEE